MRPERGANLMIGLGLKSCQAHPCMSSPIDAVTFRDSCAMFATGVAIATVLATDGSPHGLTVSSFTSVSMHPLLISICIDHGCTVMDHFRGSLYFAISVLSESQQDLSVAFAAKPEGRFDDVAWRPGETGMPLIDDALAQLECRVETIVDVGDHAVLIGEPLHASSKPGRPLLYFNRRYCALA